MTKPLTVGIDLGTTYSLVGVMQAGRPVLLRNELGELLTPSAVALDDDGSVLVGEAARARALTHPELAARWFKRDMGTPREWKLGTKSMRPEELSAVVLDHLRRCAEAALGASVGEAVVTVPAYFGELQRQATRDAGAIAGLVVERIINEPTAAALAYGLHQREKELRAVVLDLGGGTFDVTVLEIMEGVIEIQSSAGDARLGGEDFVGVLTQHVVGRVRDRYGALPKETPRIIAQVHEACERAKVRLSDRPTTDVVMPRLTLDDGREIDATIELTREQAQAVWRPVLTRLRGPVTAALRDARIDPRDLDEVLLVGGATRMPAVVDLFAEMFGRMPSRSLAPDETVALGSVVQAALKQGDAAVEDLVVTDVAPFTLGIETGTLRAGRVVEGMFSPLIERGTVIPASREQTFVPLVPGQDRIEVDVFQGEHPMCRDNTRLGSMVVSVPKAKDPADQGVRVRFTYDLNGLLEVEATVVKTGKRQQLLIERRPGALTNKQMVEARAAMARLKFHPRESLPNRTALGRADVAYMQASGGARDLLSQAIADFEAALEGQRDSEIAAARENLNALVAAIDGA